MTKHVWCTLIAALGLAFAGLAHAGDMPTFEEVDANSDGAISRNEAAATPGLDFAKADTNKDGWLSRDEYKAAVG